MPKMVYSKKQAFKLKIEETKRMIEVIAKYYGFL